jgi:hypothetical protein
MINKDTFITGNLNENHKTHRKAAMYAILGDLLFIVLPLVVISIVDVSVGRSLFAIIESPELSFGSAVLFGQTIIKVVSGFAHTKPSGAEQPVFIIALIIVFGLFGVNGHALSLRFGGRQLDRQTDLSSSK